MLTAYPDLASSTVDTKNPLAGFQEVLNPASDATYAFIKDLLEEMAGLFPGRYFHVGGDEVPDNAWNGNGQIQRFMKEKRLASKVELRRIFSLFTGGPEEAGQDHDWMGRNRRSVDPR